MSARGFGNPDSSQHTAKSLALGLQDTALLQPPNKLQQLLSHAGRHSGSQLKTRLCNNSKSLRQTKCLWPGMAQVKFPALSTRIGQLAPAFMVPQRVPCLRELSCLLLFTVLGAPLEWQASALAVDSVMWYALQLHRVHGLAETCGAVLPGELFPQHRPFRAKCVLQVIYVSRKPTDLPFQVYNFFGYFFP